MLYLPNQLICLGFLVDIVICLDAGIYDLELPPDVRKHASENCCRVIRIDQDTVSHS